MPDGPVDPPDFGLVFEPSPTGIVVHVTGELDLATIEALARLASLAGPGRNDRPRSTRCGALFTTRSRGRFPVSSRRALRRRGCPSRRNGRCTVVSGGTVNPASSASITIETSAGTSRPSARAAASAPMPTSRFDAKTPVGGCRRSSSRRAES
jgi:hypothetical protein